MRKWIRRLFVAVGSLVALLIVAFIALAAFFDVNHYKPQIEAAVLKASGLNLAIDGKASLGFLPHTHLSVKKVRLSNPSHPLKTTGQIFSADELRISLELLPFALHRQLIIDKVSIVDPQFNIEKDPLGRMNFETAKTKTSPVPKEKTASAGPGAGQLHLLDIDNGKLTYFDRSSANRTQIEGINIKLSDLRWGGTDLMKTLSLHGTVDAKSIKSESRLVTNFKSDLQVRDQVISLTKIEAQAFGGTAAGNVQADLKGAAPKFRIDETVKKLDLAQLFANSKNPVTGLVDANVRLTASGKATPTILRSAAGEVSLHGQDVTLGGVDVDGLAGMLKTAQGLNLVSLGSAVSGLLAPIAGTVQPVVGQAAGVAGGKSPEQTKLKKLVSNWQISNGVAHTKDVALATQKTTIAFKGDINLVSQTYQNFAIAPVDSKGCAKTSIEITGPLKSPKPVAGSIAQQVSKSYLGQFGSEVGGAAGGLLGAKHAPSASCQPPFYTGSANTG